MKKRRNYRNKDKYILLHTKGASTSAEYMHEEKKNAKRIQFKSRVKRNRSSTNQAKLKLKAKAPKISLNRIT
jgi:hypothetical protein